MSLSRYEECVFVDIIQSIVAVGGFGYLNYYVFNRICDYRQKTDREVSFEIFFFSSLDYSLFLLSSSLISNKILASVATVFLAVVLTLCAPWFVKLFYWLVNKLRRKKGLDDLDPQSVYDIATQGNDDLVFIFTLTGEYISSGQCVRSNGEHEEMSMILVPFIETNPEYAIFTEKDMRSFFEREAINPRVYINFQKEIKFYYYDRP